jgi:sigma-B regulation protein RsbU (phosphoserine phosphatase)
MPTPAPVSDREPATRMECAQVYGGTQAARMPIALPGLEGFVYSQPCHGAAGGDIHYLSICGSGLLSRFCVADVVGHGEDVAIVSAEAHEFLRRSVNWTDHRRVLRLLNGALTGKGLDSLTTAAMFTYSPPTRSLTYSYAGHPPAWRYSARRGEWSTLALDDADVTVESAAAVNDLPLAVSADTAYSRGRLRPDAGDVIVVMTDGVDDATDASNQRLGREGVQRLLAGLRDHAPQSIVESVIDGVASFCGTDSFTHDDVTILALRIQPYSWLQTARTMLANRLVRPFSRKGP